jgi:hypothetical protein
MTDSDREMRRLRRRRRLRRVLAWVARWFPAETAATAVVVFVGLRRVGLHWAAAAFAILTSSIAYGVVRRRTRAWTASLRRRTTRRCSGPAGKISCRW